MITTLLLSLILIALVVWAGAHLLFALGILLIKIIWFALGLLLGLGKWGIVLCAALLLFLLKGASVMLLGGIVVVAIVLCLVRATGRRPHALAVRSGPVDRRYYPDPSDSVRRVLRRLDSRMAVIEARLRRFD